MTRPRACRRIRFRPNIKVYKPQGIPARELEYVELTNEEIEALRLKNVENFDQTEAAKKMKTSQSSFQRILASAYKKISQALINGKGIKLDS